MQYDYMIKEVIEVDDAEATKGYGKGERREDYADAWRNTGTVVLIGLQGSGKAALARLLAQRTGLDAVCPGDAEAAVAALVGEPAIVILTDDLVADPAVQPHIHGAGKVFYLMADSRTLASRVASDGQDAEQVWRDLSARLAVMEPVFYSVLHFIIQAGDQPEALVDDALEKIAY